MKGYMQRMLSTTFRDENFNLSIIHVSIVVVLILDLSVTCGLNFRTTAASCSFRMIVIFLCFPLLRSCESCLSEVQMCCSFFDGDLVFQMFFCSLTIPLCVLVF